MLTNFRAIDPTKLSLKYLDIRINSENYRGEVSSQHNRYTVDDIVLICSLLDKYTPEGEKLKVRNTDLSKRPETAPDEIQYARFVDEIKTKTGKGTQDTIRKNYFPDYERGGLIKTYNPNFELNDPWITNQKRYVELTNFGREFIKGDIVDRQIAFSKYIDNLLGGFVSILNTILLHDEFKKFGQEKIFFEEFQFFISALNAPDSDFKINKFTDCINLMKDFRKIPRATREALKIMMSEQLKPENFPGDEKAQRDFHNWNNKIQQIFDLLGQTPHFEVASNYKFIAFKTSIKSGDFDTEKNRKRNLSEKIKYRSKHTKNKKIPGFELDHLIPFSWAKSYEENNLIDNHKNMLYIDGYSHAIKTQNRSKHYILEPLNELDFQLKSLNPDDPPITLVFDKNVIYDPQYRDEILEYNKQLCEIV